MRTTTFLCILGLLTLVQLRSEQPAAGQQVEQELETASGKTVPYLLYLPEEYDAKEANWPLMLFLHGRGESRGPLSLVKKWGPPRLIERGEKFPYVIVSPQCPPNESWGQPQQQQLLIALLDHLAGAYKIDQDRIYLTGLSMGGFGSWQLAATHPDRFAAVIPICGGGNPANAGPLKHLPIWVFHGTEDTAVPFQRSVEMVEAIRNAGSGTIRFTSLENIGHLSWEAAYATPDIYHWLEQQTASKNRSRAKSE